ncbi:MAG: hypothetical protein AB2693_30070 [Candidatus Thiodiazotropha sp.]
MAENAITLVDRNNFGIAAMQKKVIPSYERTYSVGNKHELSGRMHEQMICYLYSCYYNVIVAIFRVYLVVTLFCAKFYVYSVLVIMHHTAFASNIITIR